ncbi:MAG: tetratricopeptide repeat protein [Woeseiaceae bacterium]
MELAEKNIKVLSAKINANDTNANLYLSRADIYFQLRNFDNAVEDYTQAIKLDNALDKAWFGRGMALGRQGFIAKGIYNLSVYIKRNPNDSVAYTKRGVRYLWLGDKDNAELDLLQAIKIDAKNAEAHDDLGVVYAQKGDYKKAIQHFSKTIRLDPSYQKGYHNLAMSLFVMENDVGALLNINKSLELKKTRDSVLLKSTILKAMGNIEEAQALADEADFIPETNWSERAVIR